MTPAGGVSISPRNGREAKRGHQGINVKGNNVKGINAYVQLDV
jgi:hypothetical protein